MYRGCHHCGKINEKTAEKCVRCGHSLKTTAWQRLRRKLFGKRSRRMLMAELAILVIALTVTLVFVIRSQSPQSSSPAAPAPSVDTSEPEPIKF